MNRSSKIFGFIWLVAVLLLTSFTDKAGSEIPRKKIDKTLSKLFKSNNFDLVSMAMEAPCFEGAIWLLVTQNGAAVAYVMVNRVESCRAGGCDASFEMNQQPNEFFDYFMVLSLKGEVLRVRIYNYQATRGHEVMSKGWLRQFSGVKPHQKLEVGNNIQAISGATISAKAITANIVSQAGCLGDFLTKTMAEK